MHKVLSKGALNLKVYKTASCAEIAENYFHHWINMTCEKVAINGPNLKKLAPKESNWRKTKKILTRTLGTLEGRLSFHDFLSQDPCPGVGLEVKI